MTVDCKAHMSAKQGLIYNYGRKLTKLRHFTLNLEKRSSPLPRAGGVRVRVATLVYYAVASQRAVAQSASRTPPRERGKSAPSGLRG